MNFIYIIIAIFITVFLIFLFFSYRSESKGDQEHPLLIALFVSTVFGLLVSVIISICILALTGSLNLINEFLNLSLNQKQIIYLMLWYLVFSFFLEANLTRILLSFFGYSKISYFVSVSILRILYLLAVGYLLSIDLDTNITIAISFALFLYLIDLLVLHYRIAVCKGGLYSAMI
ncbi:hypothetical protein GCM10008986_09520 [Salinibacillus aidingensis]|uniref:Uncharacterized protein n=1 Tax=Salinibacillus aidingensis TaxID=237684 RepID=A0ABP3KST5_9BACI